jgi:hypothetical protein
MDFGIYTPSNLEAGRYSPRRFPRGFSSGLTAISGGGTPIDAKPAPITLAFFSSQLGPHVPTERWRYTVPQNRRAKLEAAVGLLVREVAGAPTLASSADIRLQRKGATIFSEIIAMELGFNSGVGASNNMIHSGPVELFEGDSIFCITGDGSTGGQVDYSVSATLTEFDSIVNTLESRQAGNDASSVNPGPSSGDSARPIGYAQTSTGGGFLFGGTTAHFG